MNHISWQKYIIAFFITAGIFVVAFLVSSKLNQTKLESLQATREKIAIDILSTETQFSLLAQSSCEEISTPVLSRELSTLGSRLAFAENSLEANEEEVLRLKKYYSLLLIKDLLLGQKIAEKCEKKEPISILYFYSNEGNCTECQMIGHVLDGLVNDFPELRVYAFDTNLNLSAVNTLKSIFEVGDEVPAIVINEEVYYGFLSQEKILFFLPELKIETGTSTATTTPETAPSSATGSTQAK